MASPGSHDITRLLQAWGGGDRHAGDELVPLVYSELRRVAARYMRGERAGASIQATALVNEVYLRLVDVSGVRWQDRAHFFAMAAQMMRRILVDAARARTAEKRGGAACKVTLDEALIPGHGTDRELVALDDALAALAEFDPRKARVIELRFFAGLSVDETAEVLEVSPQTVLRDWNLAKAWLAREIARS